MARCEFNTSVHPDIHATLVFDFFNNEGGIVAHLEGDVYRPEPDT